MLRENREGWKKYFQQPIGSKSCPSFDYFTSSFQPFESLEQLTSVFNDRLRFTLGGELEHRTVLAGRNQTYSINNVSVDFRVGSFYENSVAGNLGLNYSFINQKQHCDIYNEFCGGSLYIQLNSRLSDETRGTYGGSVGLRLNF